MIDWLMAHPYITVNVLAAALGLEEIVRRIRQANQVILDAAIAEAADADNRHLADPGRQLYVTPDGDLTWNKP